MLEVADESGATSTDTRNFTLMQDVAADFYCTSTVTYEGDGSEYGSCGTWGTPIKANLTVPQGRTVLLVNKSIPSQGESFGPNAYYWEFMGGDPSTSSQKNPTTTFPQVLDSGTTTLTVTDTGGRQDTATWPIRVVAPLPGWKEGDPFFR